MEEFDGEPTLEDLSEALDSLTSGRALGKDGIPAVVLKCCKGSLIIELHEILFLCWREGEVLQGMRDANIVTLKKTKVTGATAIFTSASFSSASLGSYLLESH